MDLGQIASRVAAKIPHSMRLKNPSEYIKRALRDYDVSSWDGMVHRIGPEGSYYHVSQEGAEFYQDIHPEHEVESMPLPSFSNAALIDLDRADHLEFLYQIGDVKDPNLVDDMSSLIDQILPEMRKLGFDGVIINGETGSDVEGPPIEIVKL